MVWEILFVRQILSCLAAPADDAPTEIESGCLPSGDTALSAVNSRPVLTLNIQDVGLLQKDMTDANL